MRVCAAVEPTEDDLGAPPSDVEDREVAPIGERQSAQRAAKREARLFLPADDPRGDPERRVDAGSQRLAAAGVAHGARPDHGDAIDAQRPD